MTKVVIDLKGVGFTERERDVAMQLITGKSNFEIATALCLSEKTVKNRVSCILGKLHVRDRLQAVCKLVGLL